MKISIITPFHNARQYLNDCIKSVLSQSHTDWELLLVNDGSNDGSRDVVLSYKDPRIILLEQENRGVSAARNLGLENMRGDFFCFLDADDLMTEESLSKRLTYFNDPKVAFVGGGQEHRSKDLSLSLNVQRPSYQGNPRKGLVSIDETCFINCGTWLIKRDFQRMYKFQNGWTHCEDLAFFLSISDSGDLVSIADVVQIYRRHDDSAMSHLRRLEEGYGKFIKYAKQNGFILNYLENIFLRVKVKKIMFLSYLAGGQKKEAFQQFFR